MTNPLFEFIEPTIAELTPDREMLESALSEEERSSISEPEMVLSCFDHMMFRNRLGTAVLRGVEFCLEHPELDREKLIELYVEAARIMCLRMEASTDRLNAKIRELTEEGEE